MNKLLACMIVLTLSCVCQNVLAEREYITDGTVASCAGPAEISGISTPGSITTHIGDFTAHDIVIDGTTTQKLALFADKDFNNIGSAQSTTVTGGSLPASSTSYDQYALLGGKWTTKNPMLKYTYYGIGQPNYLSSLNVVSDINAATKIWDSQTSQMLFGLAGAAVTSTKRAQMSYNAWDGIHEVGWTNLGTSIASPIAMTSCTWYTASGSMIDSDVGFNKQWIGSWTTGTSSSTSLKADVESIALHEFGHVLGLDDIYNKPLQRFDTTEIMNSNRNHRYLGQGDILGIHMLYGY